MEKEKQIPLFPNTPVLQFLMDDEDVRRII